MKFWGNLYTYLWYKSIPYVMSPMLCYVMYYNPHILILLIVKESISLTINKKRCLGFANKRNRYMFCNKNSSLIIYTTRSRFYKIGSNDKFVLSTINKKSLIKTY